MTQPKDIEGLRKVAEEARAVARRLLACCRDWDGSDMSDEAEPINVKCELLRRGSQSIDALLSELEAVKGGGWRPIETAPRDGTRFLGLTKYGVEMVKWSEHEGRELEPLSGWIGVEQDSTCFPGNSLHPKATYQPTHWQPLPDPPSPLSTGLDAEGSAEGGGEDDLRKAGAVMLADYQTSERHHPDYVLVSLAAFEAMRVALAKVETEGL